MLVELVVRGGRHLPEIRLGRLVLPHVVACVVSLGGVATLGLRDRRRGQNGDVALVVLRVRGVLLRAAIVAVGSVDHVLTHRLEGVAAAVAGFALVAENARFLHLFFAFLGPLVGVHAASLRTAETSS